MFDPLWIRQIKGPWPNPLLGYPPYRQVGASYLFCSLKLEVTVRGEEKQAGPALSLWKQGWVLSHPGEEGPLLSKEGHAL